MERVMQIGHLHVMGGPFCQGGMDVFQSGCFEGTNSYLRRKGLTPDIGGYIFEADVTEDGTLRRLTTTRLRYREQEDDYARHRTPSR